MEFPSPDDIHDPHHSPRTIDICCSVPRGHAGVWYFIVVRRSHLQKHFKEQMYLLQSPSSNFLKPSSFPNICCSHIDCNSINYCCLLCDEPDNSFDDFTEDSLR